MHCFAQAWVHTTGLVVLVWDEQTELVRVSSNNYASQSVSASPSVSNVQCMLLKGELMKLHHHRHCCMDPCLGEGTVWGVSGGVGTGLVKLTGSRYTLRVTCYTH